MDVVATDPAAMTRNLPVVLGVMVTLATVWKVDVSATVVPVENACDCSMAMAVLASDWMRVSIDWMILMTSDLTLDSMVFRPSLGQIAHAIRTIHFFFERFFLRFFFSPAMPSVCLPESVPKAHHSSAVTPPATMIPAIHHQSFELFAGTTGSPAGRRR